MRRDWAPSGWRLAPSGWGLGVGGWRLGVIGRRVIGRWLDVGWERRIGHCRPPHTRPLASGSSERSKRRDIEYQYPDRGRARVPPHVPPHEARNTLPAYRYLSLHAHSMSRRHSQSN